MPLIGYLVSFCVVLLPLSFLNSWKLSGPALIFSEEVLTLTFHFCSNCLCFWRLEPLGWSETKSYIFFSAWRKTWLTFFKLMSWLKDQCIRIQSFLLVRSLALLSQPCLCSCSAVLYLFSLLFEFVLIQLSFFFLWFPHCLLNKSGLWNEVECITCNHTFGTGFPF